MVEIKRISIGSALKVGAVLSAMMGAFYALLIVLFGSVIQNSSAYYYYNDTSLSSSSLLVSSLCMIPILAVSGGITAAISASVYNIAAGWVGGLEIELTDKAWFRSGMSDYGNPPYGGANPYGNPYGSGTPYSPSALDKAGTTTDKLQRASDLIRHKQYKPAYALLKSMPDNPTAQKWLAKLDEIDPTLAFEVREKPQNNDWSPIQYD